MVLPSPEASRRRARFRLRQALEYPLHRSRSSPPAASCEGITETEQVTRALDDAARRWPADSGNRGKLLLHLLEEGHRAVVGQQESLVRDRRDAVARTSGALTGMYGEGYLSGLREDWPA